MIALSFGPLSKPLKEQLNGLGDVSYLDQAQLDADAISRLYLRGILTDNEAKKARKRLLGAIRASMQTT